MYKRDILLLLVIAFFFIIVVPAFLTYIYFALNLESKEGILNSKDTGVVLLDRDNQPFFTFYEAKPRSYVSLSRIPKQTQRAVISIEDRDFYQHPGFSLRGIIRALYNDITKNKISEGGSTITQQLVKNVMLSPQKSFLRKYQEIILAQEIERRYSKSEILEMYLNSVYFGEGAFGIEQAAQTYFGIHAQNLNLAQSSLLAAILSAPSELSPYHGDTTAAKRLQLKVLTNMIDQGYITKQDMNTAYSTRLLFLSGKEPINQIAPHFALMVRDELIKKYGEERISRSGFKVKTTLDRSWQEEAQRIVANQVDQLSSQNVTNGAAIVIDPKSGEVRALVGSKDWYDNSFGKVNMAITPRQPGSAFKPIVYLTAFEKGLITPATQLKDMPTTFLGNYKPLDYDRKFRGTVLARRALANSLNIPSVQVMSMVGIAPVLDMAQRMGITTLGNDTSAYGLSLVLGTGQVSLLELTNAYTTFANNGVRHNYALISEIKDKYNHVIYTNKIEDYKVVEPGYAFLINSILSDKKTRYEALGTALDTLYNAAAKTGTTEDFRDAWTIGYTPSLVVGVWVGNNNNKSMETIAGSLGAAPIFRNIMNEFLANTPKEQFAVPDTITQLSICSSNGYRVQEATSSATVEYFLKGTEPKISCGRKNTVASAYTFNEGLKQDEVGLRVKEQLKRIQEENNMRHQVGTSSAQ